MGSRRHRDQDGLPAGDPVGVLKLTARAHQAVPELSKRNTKKGVFHSMDESRNIANIVQGEPLVSWMHAPAQQRTSDSVPVWSCTNGLSVIPTAHMSIDVQDLYTKLLSYFNGNEKMAKEYLCHTITDNLVFQGVSATDVEYNHSLTHKSPVFARQIFGPVEIRVSEVTIPGQLLVAKANPDSTEYLSATSGFAEGYRGTPIEKRLIDIVPMEMASGASAFVRKLNMYLRDPRLTMVAHDPRIPGTSIGLAPLELTTQMISFSGVIFATRLMALVKAMANSADTVDNMLLAEPRFSFLAREDLAPALKYLRALNDLFFPPASVQNLVQAMANAIPAQNWLMAAFGLIPYPQEQPSWGRNEKFMYGLLESPQTRLSLLKLRNHLATIAVHDQGDMNFEFNILNNGDITQPDTEGTLNTTQGIVPNPTKLEGQALLKQASLATDWIATLKHNWLNQRYHVVGRSIETNQAGYTMALLYG